MENNIKNDSNNKAGNLLSKEIVAELQKIGFAHKLHLDQISSLETEISAVVSGEKSVDDFVDNIEKNVLVDTENAIAIAVDINEKIFIPLSVYYKKPVEDVGYQEIKRDSILSAIENPEPTEHPISIAQPKPIEKNRPSSGGDAVAGQFIGEKLSAPVTLPSQKIVVDNQTVSAKPKPSIDPYREPLN